MARTAVRAAGMLLLGVVIGVASIVGVSLGLLVGLEVNLRGDPDHAPPEGSALSPDELPEPQVPDE